MKLNYCRCHPFHVTLSGSWKTLMTAVVLALATEAFSPWTPSQGRGTNFSHRPLFSRRWPLSRPASTSPVIPRLDTVVRDVCRRTTESTTTVASPGNSESKRVADNLISHSNRFEIGNDGNVLGGEIEEINLVQALCRDSFVVVKCRCPRMIDALEILNSAAGSLLEGPDTICNKHDTLVSMRDDDEGFVGYAGGGHFGPDQFLETRGVGEERVTPLLRPRTESIITEGRRALASISLGVLRTVASHGLPGVDVSAFFEILDYGEGISAPQARGAEGGVRARSRVSSTLLRLCRYTGTSRVPFVHGDFKRFYPEMDGSLILGRPCVFATAPTPIPFAEAHTDVTFLTAVPCTSAPGLEIFQRGTGRWARPEAASDVEIGTDVIILAGELLQVLGQGRYRAAVHRVVRPAGLSEPRVSTPLLLRGVSGAIIQDSLRLALGIPNHITGHEMARKEGTAMNKVAAEESGISMKDLQAALQRRPGPSDETPLYLVRRASEAQIKENFAPFAPEGLDILSTDPLLVRLNGFVSPDECEALINEMSGSMKDSTTWDGYGTQQTSSPVRKSSTAWIADESFVPFKDWTARASDLSGLPPTFMEKWQVARYDPGGYFNPHTDHVEAFNDLECGGRLGTLIVYLNDGFEGGHTEFPLLEVSVAPRQGDAIFFHSVLTPLGRNDANDMVIDKRTVHAGLPVHHGNKWIATKWIHPLPYPHGHRAS